MLPTLSLRSPEETTQTCLEFRFVLNSTQKQRRRASDTFVVLVPPFVQPAARLVGRLAARGQVGLRGRLAAGLVGLRDGRGVDGISQAAVAPLRRPVELLRPRALGAEGRGGGARVSALGLGLAAADHVVCVGRFLPPSCSKSIGENRNRDEEAC